VIIIMYFARERSGCRDSFRL